MYFKLLLLIFIVSFNCELGNTSVLDWIWQAKTDDTTVLVADGVPLVSIPYESMTEDEKFLQEAAKFTDIQVSSPLETCQHKVVMKIRTSCTDMTEEQLAKLSVNLLNCQSAVEGRKMFPCTEEMSLKQCTTDMDADMWNTYHLMSNRARAVCYAARSTQFRALTELTVNKLMQSAHSHIKTLSSLKEGQDRLEEQTAEALSSLSTGNKALLEQQQYLKDAQITAHNLVTTNLRELNDEKALIRSGHAQLTAMTEDIRNKLAKAQEDLEQQSIKQGANHKEILQDLVYIQEQAQSIWEKIERSTNHILDRHEETIAQYEQTLHKLAQINDTIQYIWNLTDTMRREIDQKLGWITDYIGDTGEQVQKVYRTVLHVIYILVAMIVASFLQAPFLTRATIMGIVPVNLITYLKHGMETTLDFTSITVLIFLITGMHFVMLAIQRTFGPSILKTKLTNMTYQNEHSNGDAHKYTSSSYSNSIPKAPLHTRLIKKIRELYNLIISKVKYCAKEINILMQSVVSWSRQNSNAHEELSCSYRSSKKMHEDVVHNYLNSQEFPSMISDDIINNDYFKPINASQYDNASNNNRGDDDESNNDDDISDLVDAYELRRRLRKMDTLQSKSITPSFTSPRIFTCLATTRAGKQCRKIASPGRNFCHHHVSGTSLAN
ncbi:protein brambleberry-like [Odontomachus brunneus]|uniref:protein brambleberry-like n=1 Tax=Odontomachus brunneus TaxID=486640 RepID=UPI0013F2978A|nr:protein brambleberry-like [Odontomachus brunneus]